jgi:hypothetical protein
MYIYLERASKQIKESPIDLYRFLLLTIGVEFQGSNALIISEEAASYQRRETAPPQKSSDESGESSCAILSFR